jgi:hypothetical protein
MKKIIFKIRVFKTLLKEVALQSTIKQKIALLQKQNSNTNNRKIKLE